MFGNNKTIAWILKTINAFSDRLKEIQTELWEEDREQQHALLGVVKYRTIHGRVVDLHNRANQMEDRFERLLQHLELELVNVKTETNYFSGDKPSESTSKVFFRRFNSLKPARQPIDNGTVVRVDNEKNLGEKPTENNKGNKNK